MSKSHAEPPSCGVIAAPPTLAQDAEYGPLARYCGTIAPELPILGAADLNLLLQQSHAPFVRIP